MPCLLTEGYQHLFCGPLALRTVAAQWMLRSSLWVAKMKLSDIGDIDFAGKCLNKFAVWSEQSQCKFCSSLIFPHYAHAFQAWFHEWKFINVFSSFWWKRERQATNRQTDTERRRDRQTKKQTYQTWNKTSTRKHTGNHNNIIIFDWIVCDHAGQYPYHGSASAVVSLAAGSRTKQLWKRNVLKTCRAVQVNHATWQCCGITTCCFFVWRAHL